MKPKDFFFLIRDSIQAWSEDRASRQAAALAYYSVFAIAPLLALITIFVGRLLRNWLTTDDVLAVLLDQIALNLDPETANAVAGIVAYFMEPSTTIFSTLFSLGIMLFAASGLLGQIQLSMDIVWHVAPNPERGAFGIVKDRALAIGFIGILGLLIMAAFFLSTIISTVDEFLVGYLQETVRIIAYAEPLISFALVLVVFAMVFKVLPRVRISWRDVWIGALVTAILFTIGMKVLSFYFTKSGPTTAFGAAGSLVLILIWVYYSAQIFLFGAEFTKVYANRFGSHIRPDRGAIYRLPLSAAPQRAVESKRTPPPAPAAVPVTLPEGRDLPDARSLPDAPLHYGWLILATVMLFLGIILGGQRRR